MTDQLVQLGFEVGTGRPVEIPLRHLAVTGQTQESGKTTTLEGLVARASVNALAFVTKRGEGSFATGRRIQPYFRDRADWQFVTSIIDATLQEKNKFLRPWIMKICRTTKTLADVQAKVREALRTAKGINEGVYTQLDAYLELIVPEIRRAQLAPRLELEPGLNVMDVSGYATPMQMLFVQSALDWVNEKSVNTVVVIPEAWEFVPEGKGSPVKASAIALVRKGASIGNRIWVDSQDMAGVDKTILRGCAVWLIGVQRESNEIKRNLANIPATIKKPSPAAVAMLERGQFYACWAGHAIKTYVQPAWLDDATAQGIATGDIPLMPKAPPARRPAAPDTREDTVTEAEARELRATNARLEGEVNELREKLTHAFEQLDKYQEKAESSKHQGLADEPSSGRRDNGDASRTPVSAVPADEEALYQRFKGRLAEEAPKLLKVLAIKPAIDVEITRETVRLDGKSLRGRVVQLLARGFFDDGVMQTQVRTELERRGAGISDAKNLPRELDALVVMGFLTIEDGKDSKGRDRKLYKAVPDMKVNILDGAGR